MKTSSCRSNSSVSSAPNVRDGTCGLRATRSRNATRASDSRKSALLNASQDFLLDRSSLHTSYGVQRGETARERVERAMVGRCARRVEISADEKGNRGGGSIGPLSRDGVKSASLADSLLAGVLGSYTKHEKLTSSSLTLCVSFHSRQTSNFFAALDDSGDEGPAPVAAAAAAKKTTTTATKKVVVEPSKIDDK